MKDLFTVSLPESKITRDVYPYRNDKRTEGKDYPASTCQRYLGEE